MTNNYLSSKIDHHELASTTSPNLSFMSSNRFENPLLSTNRPEAERMTATNTNENFYSYGDNPTSTYTGDWGFAALEAYFVGGGPFDFTTSPMEDWGALEAMATQRELFETPKDYNKEMEELVATIAARQGNVAAMRSQIAENEERIAAIAAEMERRGFHSGDTTEDDEVSPSDSFCENPKLTSNSQISPLLKATPGHAMSSQSNTNDPVLRKSPKPRSKLPSAKRLVVQEKPTRLPNIQNQRSKSTILSMLATKVNQSNMVMRRSPVSRFTILSISVMKVIKLDTTMDPLSILELVMDTLEVAMMTMDNLDMKVVLMDTAMITSTFLHTYSCKDKVRF